MDFTFDPNSSAAAARGGGPAGGAAGRPNVPPVPLAPAGGGNFNSNLTPEGSGVESGRRSVRFSENVTVSGAPAAAGVSYGSTTPRGGGAGGVGLGMSSALGSASSAGGGGAAAAVPERRRSRSPIPVESRAYGKKEDWARYPSQSRAALELNVNIDSIQRCIAGSQQHAGGNEFRKAKKRRAVAVGGKKKPSRCGRIEGRLAGSSLWIVYESQSDASRQLRVPRPDISRCMTGKIADVGGFEFRWPVKFSKGARKTKASRVGPAAAAVAAATAFLARAIVPCTDCEIMSEISEDSDDSDDDEISEISEDSDENA